MKTLYTNGCSFTVGAELSHPQELCYPTILGSRIGSDFVVNHARSAASNFEITRKTMDYLFDYVYNKEQDPEDLTVVVGWSLVSRHEYYDTSINTSTKEKRNQWIGITPNSVSYRKDIPYYYYGLLHSTEQDMLNFFWQVITVQTFLKKHNIKYFFFKVDSGQWNMYNKKGFTIKDGWDLNKLPTKKYIEEIDLDKFPSLVDSAQTFREFALKYGSLKPDYHPDEKSHELFSEYIEERL